MLLLSLWFVLPHMGGARIVETGQPADFSLAADMRAQHPGSSDRAMFTLAKRIWRANDRLGPARVYRPMVLGPTQVRRAMSAYVTYCNRRTLTSR